MIKEITLSSIGMVPFLSFWVYFVFCAVAIIVLIATYKLKSKVEYINFALSFFFVTFYSFSYYTNVNLDFSLYMPVILYMYLLNGTYFRLMILLVIGFSIIHFIIIRSTIDRIIIEN